MKQLSGSYSEIEFVRSESIHEQGNRAAEHAVKLDEREWDENVQRLAAAFGMRRDLTELSAPAFAEATAGRHSQNATEPLETIPLRKLSPLQEDEERYYAMAVLNKTDDHLKLATVSWPKEPLESWLARAETQISTASVAAGSSYALPQISGAGCIDNTWTPTAGPPDARSAHTAVWTGSEMIVWGGYISGYINTGGMYNPSADTWTATSIHNAREPHSSLDRQRNDYLGRR